MIKIRDMKLVRVWVRRGVPTQRFWFLGPLLHSIGLAIVQGRIYANLPYLLLLWVGMFWATVFLEEILIQLYPE